MTPLVKPSHLHEQLADVVRDAIIVRGVSQSWIALHLGISQKHVSQLLNGLSHGSLGTWQEILAILDVKVGITAVFEDKR